MTSLYDRKPEFRNAESPFTELFLILKKSPDSTADLSTLIYDPAELRVMHQHIDNAIDLLLQGLQDLGQLMSLAGRESDDVLKELANLGFFISGISNLTEALNTLRNDADYVLNKNVGLA